MEHPVTNIIRCASPAELLNTLHAIDIQPAVGGWLFRGQARARTWTLIPSVLRTRSLDAAEEFERQVLVSLREHLRRRSILPDRMLDLHGDSVLAIAQHYGCETRLLDWTRSIYVAAYFAAADALRLDVDENYAVFALSCDSRFSWDPQGWPRAFKDSSPVETLQGGNENLAAQSGVLVKHGWACVDFWVEGAAKEVSPSALPPYEVVNAWPPYLYRVEAPISSARELLAMLHARNVDAVNLFPGMRGFAQHAADAARMWIRLRRGVSGRS